jgi:hypothetical protein
MQIFLLATPQRSFDGDSSKAVVCPTWPHSLARFTSEMPRRVPSLLTDGLQYLMHCSAPTCFATSRAARPSAGAHVPTAIVQHATIKAETAGSGRL